MQYRNSQHLAPMIKKPYHKFGDRPEATLFPDNVDTGTALVFQHFIPMQSIQRIQVEECEKAGITLEEMLSDDVCNRLAHPRMKAMARSRDETGKPLTVIARAFKRDHTTVMHAHKKFGRQK